MEKITSAILRHRKIVIVVFLLMSLASVFLMMRVKVNYDLVDYLPQDVPSTIALEMFEEEFTEPIPNLDLVVKDIDIGEVLRLKSTLLELEEVTSVIWLDDVANLTEPIETIPRTTLESFYKDRMAHLMVAVESDDMETAIASIAEVIPYEYIQSGQAFNAASTTKATASEMVSIMAFAIPIALGILLWSSNSYFEALLFVVSVLLGGILNMGTNIIFGEISFITQAVGIVLQLAVSMDYSIFLLNRFGHYRAEGDEIHIAMQKAMIKSFSAITTSASTTFFGFLALIFMRFLLGVDLGLVLAKGIIFSLLTALVFLPAVAVTSYKLIDRTGHRSYLPSKNTTIKFGKFIKKLTPLIIIGVLILAPTFYLAQGRIHFLYGMEPFPEGSKELEGIEFIDDNFGQGQSLLLLVPSGQPDKEVTISKALHERGHIISVMSYADTVGHEIPAEILDKKDLSALDSGNYTRFIIQTKMEDEGLEVFQEVEKLRALSQEIYGDDTHWIGQAFSLYDMSKVIQEDDNIVNGLSVLFIALVLLINFRSLSLPIILVFTIRFATWTNLSILYFTGRPINYIGFLVISTIQLGATVDYGILMTENYLDLRKKYEPKQAVIEAIALTLPAIVPPALILSSVGFILNGISSIAVVADIGLVLGRGALFSLLFVIILLPNLLWLSDPIIRYTTLAPGTRKLYKNSMLFKDTSK